MCGRFKIIGAMVQAPRRLTIATNKQIRGQLTRYMETNQQGNQQPPFLLVAPSLLSVTVSVAAALAEPQPSQETAA